MTPAFCPVAPVRSRQKQHRLSSAEIEQLIIIYLSGRNVNQLAEQFEVDRTTVLAHLRRAGVPPQQRKIGEQQLLEVIERYAAGESLVQLARHFSVDAETVRKMLVKAGVRRRARGRNSNN